MSQVDRLRLCHIVAPTLWLEMESNAAFTCHMGLWRSKAGVSEAFQMHCESNGIGLAPHPLYRKVCPVTEAVLAKAMSRRLCGRH